MKLLISIPAAQQDHAPAPQQDCAPVTQTQFLWRWLWFLAIVVPIPIYLPIPLPICHIGIGTRSDYLQLWFCNWKNCCRFGWACFPPSDVAKHYVVWTGANIVWDMTRILSGNWEQHYQKIVNVGIVAWKRNTILWKYLLLSNILKWKNRPSCPPILTDYLVKVFTVADRVSSTTTHSTSSSLI